MKKIKNIVFLFINLLLLLSFVQLVQAESDSAISEWKNSYGPITLKSVIQTIDGGYAMLSEDGEYIPLPSTRSYWTRFLKLTKINANGSISWNRTFYELGERRPSSLIQTEDCGFVILGHFSNGSHWLMKTDSQGNILWEKVYAKSYHTSGATAVFKHNDGYVICFTTYSGESYFGYVHKIDENGNELWATIIEENSKDVWISSATIAKNGEIALLGTWENKIWFSKLDQNGNVIASKIFDTGQESISTPGVYPSSIAITKDNGYVILGHQLLLNSDELLWIFILDSNGNVIGEAQYNFGDDVVYYPTVFQVGDGGFVGAGFYKDNSLVFKTNSEGIMQWNTTIFGIHQVNCFIQTNDNGYLLGGNDQRWSNSQNNIVLEKFLPDSPIISDNSSTKSLLSSETLLILTIVTLALGICVLIYYLKKKN